MKSAQESRDDLNVFVIWHPEKDKDGEYKMKTIGNMVDAYLTPEGLMDIILYADCQKNAKGEMEYYYITNNDGVFGARSPIEMFESLHIPNDLGYVKDKIDEFYK